MLTRVKRKLRSKRGETLVESLLSIVIVALSAAMFMMASVTASGVLAKSREKADRFGDDLSNAVVQTAPAGETTVRVVYDGSGVYRYGTRDGYTVAVFSESPLKSYKPKG